MGGRHRTDAALQTVPVGRDRAEKVREDRAEELATASATDLTGDALEPDLDEVADTREREQLGDQDR